MSQPIVYWLRRKSVAESAHPRTSANPSPPPCPGAGQAAARLNPPCHPRRYSPCQHLRSLSVYPPLAPGDPPSERPSCDLVLDPVTEPPARLTLPCPAPPSEDLALMALVEDQLVTMRAGVEDALASRLRELEATVERGLAHFFAVGEALREIRDSALYKLTHPTWEVYCRERWNISRSRSYQLIAAVVTTLSTTVDKPLTERQARRIVTRPAELQRVARSPRPRPPRQVIRIERGRVIVEATGDVIGNLEAAIAAELEQRAAA